MDSSLKPALKCALPPAPGMNLRFYYYPIATQLMSRGSSLLRCARYLPPGVWDRKLIEENLSLILVDIHDAVGAERMSHPRSGQGCMSAERL